MQTSRAGAHEHDLAGDGIRIEVALEHGPGGDMAGRLVPAGVQPETPFEVGRNLELADPHGADARLLAESEHAACPRRFDHVGRNPRATLSASAASDG